jgi:hypothetical protein
MATSSMARNDCSRLYKLPSPRSVTARLNTRLKCLAVPLSIASFALTSESLAGELPERLKGYSIDAQSTMRMDGRDKGRPFQEFNTRFMRIYISSSGRIFDYSKVEAVGARTGQFAGGNSGMKVVRFGEEWLLGNVGQRWDASSTGLIKSRIYPWGKQIYSITISSDLRNCTITEEMRSTLPDKRFFLFQWSGHTISEVVSHETVASSCQIFDKNIFDESVRGGAEIK